MAVDGLIHNAAPASAPPKGACGRPLCACGHSVGRVVPRRPLTSGRHEHTEQLGAVVRKPPQEASGRASGGRCEEVKRMRKPQPNHGRRARAALTGGSPCGRDEGVMRMRKPQSMHGCRAGAAASGGSPCGRDPKRRPCAGGDPGARLSSAASLWIASRTGASTRRLTAGTRTVRPGQTTCGSLPRFGPHSIKRCGGSRWAFRGGTLPATTATRTT